MTSDVLSSVVSLSDDKQYLYSNSFGWISSPFTSQDWDWNTWVVLNGDYDYGPAGGASTGTFSCTHTNVEFGDYGFGCVESGGGSGWKVMPAGGSSNYNSAAGTCLICQDNPGVLGNGCAAGVQIWVREDTVVTPSCSIGSSGACASSCLEILNNSNSTGDGTYLIDPEGAGAFEAYCDMTTDTGGWTLVGLGLESANQSDLDAWNDDSALNQANAGSGTAHFHLSSAQINSILNSPAGQGDFRAGCEADFAGSTRYWTGVNNYSWSSATSAATCNTGYNQSGSTQGAQWNSGMWGLSSASNIVTSHEFYSGIHRPWYCGASHAVDIEVWAK